MQGFLSLLFGCSCFLFPFLLVIGLAAELANQRPRMRDAWLFYAIGTSALLLNCIWGYLSAATNPFALAVIGAQGLFIALVCGLVKAYLNPLKINPINEVQPDGHDSSSQQGPREKPRE